jgi:antitoxin MazE
MTAVISNWGNSQGLRVPKDIMKELNLSVGDKINIKTQSGSDYIFEVK